MILQASGLNISELVEAITWSGDTRQVARKLTFTIASKHTDPYLPKVDLNEGDPVTLDTDDGVPLFLGVIFDIDVTASAAVTSYMAYDLLWYILNSEISQVFDASPEAIAGQVCGELGVPLAGAAPTGIHVYYPCLSKSGYEAIMAPYTTASRQNGKKYIPLMDQGSLRVLEKGKPCGVTLDGDFNLLDANYKTTLTSVVNRVVIVDKTGKKVGEVQDAGLRQQYGTVQKVVKQGSGSDPHAEARNMLSGIDQSATARGLSDHRCRSGYSVNIREPVTGLVGRFYVESDSHTFKNAEETMDLTLAFDCIMDEKEIEKEADS